MSHPSRTTPAAAAAPALPDARPPADLVERVATVELDREGVVVALDDAAEALFGDRTTMGRRLIDLAIASDRVGLRALLDQVTTSRAALRGEFGLRCADGHVMPTAILAVPRPTGPTPAGEVSHPTADGAGPIGTTAFLHDISSRRSTEQVLAATQAMTGSIARAQSPGRAVESLVSSLGRSMGWEVGGFWTLSPDGAALDLLTAWRADGGDADALMTHRFELAGSLSERAFTSGEATWASNLTHARMLTDAGTPAESGLHGAVVVPVMRAGAPSGVLAFLSTSARQPERGILEALTVAGGQVGELLGMLQERLDAVDTLRRLALTDELTGLPNRRAWEESVRRELARAVRDRHPVCIAVLDLDGFKRFNDEHGHQAGDRALAASARAWQSQMRSSDVLARYGGEEFAALIPAWPLEIAVEVVERLRRATAEGLTASAGVASWDGHETGEELFARADAALYEAKQTGRDRTVAAR